MDLSDQLRQVLKDQLAGVLELANQKKADAKALLVELDQAAFDLINEHGGSPMMDELVPSVARDYRMKAAGLLYDAAVEFDARLEAGIMTVIRVVEAVVLKL